MNKNNEINKVSTDIKVLEERVKKNEEILNIWFRTYRNYGILIAAFITLVGMGAIYYITEQIVKSTTENKLEETLTDEYIEGKIKERSQTAINKLISEVETRAQTIMEENLPHQELATKAILACRDCDYERGIELYKKAVAKIDILSSFYDKPVYIEEYVAYSLDLAEIQIFNGDYNESLKTVRTIFPLIKDKTWKAGYYFLVSIAKKLINLDTSESEKKLDEILKKRIRSEWSFKNMEIWLKGGKISAESKLFILNKIELMKKNMN